MPLVTLIFLVGNPCKFAEKNDPHFILTLVLFIQSQDEKCLMNKSWKFTRKTISRHFAWLASTKPIFLVSFSSFSCP